MRMCLQMHGKIDRRSYKHKNFTDAANPEYTGASDGHDQENGGKDLERTKYIPFTSNDAHGSMLLSQLTT